MNIFDGVIGKNTFFHFFGLIFCSGRLYSFVNNKSIEKEEKLSTLLAGSEVMTVTLHSRKIKEQ